MVAIVRGKAAWGRLGVKKSAFHDKFVQKPGGSEIVAGTKGVRRLRPVPGMPGCFFDDELDAVIEGIRAERDAEPQIGRVRNAAGKFVDAAGNFVPKEIRTS